MSIEKELNKFPEVAWDRFSGTIWDERGITVFGWLERDDDYKDFVVLNIRKTGIEWILTSSVKHSEEFSKKAGITSSHKDCKRVEHRWINTNHIKLK